MSTAKNIVLLAGEASGDILGEGLISHLKKHYPDARFWGIGGPRMQNAGLQSMYPLERLSVMGLFEPLKRLPELLKIRRHVISSCLKERPDIFIGIDSPDFNIGIESKLRANGIKTAHYVGPSVWAWRQGRIHKIKKAIDLVLLLFPFEKKIYEENNVPYKWVGHTLADQFPVVAQSKELARETLFLTVDSKIIGLLPGSRQSELKYLVPSFIETAKILLANNPNLKLITAMANEGRAQQFESMLKQFKDAPPINIFVGKSREVISASDCVILASGTVTLETMLLKRPMVVAYKMSPLTYQIAKRVIKVPYIALPNLLANKRLVPELIQDKVVPAEMAREVEKYINDEKMTQDLIKEFTDIHLLMKKDASKEAADAIVELMSRSVK